MTTTLVPSLTASRRRRYELQVAINHNTVRAWFMVMVALLLVFACRWAYTSVIRDWFFREPMIVEVLVPRPVHTVSIPALIQTHSSTVSYAKSTRKGATATRTQAGTPVAVAPDAMIETSFATLNDMHQVGAQFGDDDAVLGTPDGVSNGTIASAEPSEASNIDDPLMFVAHEVEPDVDYAGLQRLIVYPDMAKRHGVEGTVTIQVLVDVDGKPAKVVVYKGVNVWLDNEAVRAASLATYTPAQQSNRAVAAWLTIPVVFSLR